MGKEKEINTYPVFPLSINVLPGAYLPLQIFEPRYLDMVKNNYSKFLFLSEVTIHVIKDIILDRHNKLQCDEITEHFKKILVKKSDFMCINIIDKLDSFDDYHEKNVNTSLIIDNLIYSI